MKAALVAVSGSAAIGSETVRMVFTPRDAETLHWINGHGFVTGRQVTAWLDIHHQFVHPRLKFLIETAISGANALATTFSL